MSGIEAQMELGDNAYLDAGFTIPKPFGARSIPRSEDGLIIIKKQWEIAYKQGYELRGMPIDINGMVPL